MPATTSSLGLSALKGSGVVGRLYVTKEPDEARDIVSFNFSERWAETIPEWTILKVYTKERGKVDPDFGFEDYYYLTEPIPPKNIEVYREYFEEEGNLTYR